MIPTPRLLVLLLLGAVVVAGASLAPILVIIAVAYFGVLLGLVVADVLLTTRPDQIVVARIAEPKLSLGVPNMVEITLTNTTARPIVFAVRDEHPHQFSADATILNGTLPPLASTGVRYYVLPVQRGAYRWGDTNLRYVSALGTFRRQARYATANEVRVYPNVLDVRKYDIMARKGLLTEMGLRHTRALGGGTEFERLREYTPDDEWRRINWKATARRNKLIATEYEAERSQQVVCVLDTGRLMRPPIGLIQKLDYAVNAALLTSYVASLRGDQIGLLTFADQVDAYLAPRKGNSQFYTMLELLYNVKSQAVEADYARALGYLGVKNKRRSLVIVFSDLVTKEAAMPLIGYMTRLAKHHLPLLVIMNDPNITNLAAREPTTAQDVYERAVAEQLLDERRLILDTLNQAGVLTLDVPADKLSVSVIDKYLELKNRGAL